MRRKCFMFIAILIASSACTDQAQEQLPDSSPTAENKAKQTSAPEINQNEELMGVILCHQEMTVSPASVDSVDGLSGSVQCKVRGLRVGDQERTIADVSLDYESCQIPETARARTVTSSNQDGLITITVSLTGAEATNLDNCLVKVGVTDQDGKVLESRARGEVKIKSIAKNQRLSLKAPRRMVIEASSEPATRIMATIKPVAMDSSKNDTVKDLASGYACSTDLNLGGVSYADICTNLGISVDSSTGVVSVDRATAFAALNGERKLLSAIKFSATAIGGVEIDSRVVSIRVQKAELAPKLVNSGETLDCSIGDSGAGGATRTKVVEVRDGNRVELDDEPTQTCTSS